MEEGVGGEVNGLGGVDGKGVRGEEGRRAEKEEGGEKVA